MGKQSRGTRARSDAKKEHIDDFPVTSQPSGSIDLKGADPATVVGRCMTVLYDEGGATPTPFSGVVFYAEPTR